MNYRVSVTYTPRRRVVYGKRTHPDTSYIILADRADALALYRKLRAEHFADHPYRHDQFCPRFACSPVSYPITEGWRSTQTDERNRRARAKRRRMKAI